MSHPDRQPTVFFPMALPPAKNHTQTHASVLACCRHSDSRGIQATGSCYMEKAAVGKYHGRITRSRTGPLRRTYVETAGRDTAFLLLLFVPSVSPRLAASATFLLYLWLSADLPLSSASSLPAPCSCFYLCAPRAVLPPIHHPPTRLPPLFLSIHSLQNKAEMSNKT